MPDIMEPAAWPAVVSFPERLDGSNAAQTREQMLAVLGRGAPVVIADMSATVSWDGAGVDALARAYQRALICQADLRLVAPAPAVRELLAVEGLDRLVPVYSSVQAAVAAGPRADPGTPDDPPAATEAGALQVVREPGPGSVSAAVLRQVVDALADGIVLAGHDGRIVLANRQAAAMFGYQPDELAGRPVESLLPASLRNRHQLDRAAYSAQPAARPMADRARLVGLRQDGTTIPVAITLSPVPTVTGPLVLAVVRDGTRERWQDDFNALLRATLAEQAHHAEDLLERITGHLFQVGLSLNKAATQPAEQAREQIGKALQQLDDTIREIRDHLFRFRHHGDQEPGG